MMTMLEWMKETRKLPHHQKAVELRQQGMTYAAIGREIDRSHEAVRILLIKHERRYNKYLTHMAAKEVSEAPVVEEEPGILTNAEVIVKAFGLDVDKISVMNTEELKLTSWFVSQMIGNMAGIMKERNTLRVEAVNLRVANSRLQATEAKLAQALELLAICRNNLGRKHS